MGYRPFRNLLLATYITFGIGALTQEPAWTEESPAATVDGISFLDYLADTMTMGNRNGRVEPDERERAKGMFKKNDKLYLATSYPLGFRGSTGRILTSLEGVQKHFEYVASSRQADPQAIIEFDRTGDIKRIGVVGWKKIIWSNPEKTLYLRGEEQVLTAVKTFDSLVFDFREEMKKRREEISTNSHFR